MMEKCLVAKEQLYTSVRLMHAHMVDIVMLVLKLLFCKVNGRRLIALTQPDVGAYMETYMICIIEHGYVWKVVLYRTTTT